MTWGKISLDSDPPFNLMCSKLSRLNRPRFWLEVEQKGRPV